MQINKRIEEILTEEWGETTRECFADALNRISSLLHDFSREVVGEDDIKDSPYREVMLIARLGLRSEQLERADKLLNKEEV